MRLTVRTLLAYLDGVLDKESSEVLSQKIAESSFAGDLAERVRTSVGNGQLSSPEPGAVHPIEDPNTIAEYLDNVLQAQHVPEVERVLIESDMHLSEAAACHQILTLVLSRPANVPTEMRDKMYRLSEKLRSQGHAGNGASGDSKPFDSQIPTRDASVSDSVPSAAGGLSAPGTVLPDGSAADLGAADVGAAPFPAASTLSPAKSNGHASGAPVPSSPRPSVPDYLRSGRPSRVLPALLTLGLLAVLGFIVAKAVTQPLRNIADKTNVITPENPLRVDPEKVGPDGFGPTGETPGMVAAAQPVPADDSDSNAERSEPASFRDPETNVTPTTPAPAPTEPESTEPASSPKDPTPVSADPVNPAMVETPDANPAAPPVTETAESPVAPEVPEMIEPVEDPAPAKVEIQSIGKLTTSDSLLLAQSSDGKWIRVVVDGALMSRTRIVNPPTFRNVVALKDGLNVTLVGAGELSIDVDADGNVQLFVEYGRFLIRSETPGSTLGISMHGNSGLLTLPEATSVVGVHVTQFRLAGADPRAGGKAEPVIAIQATEGEASMNWLEGSAECGINPGELSLATGDRWAAHCSNASISKAADLAPWVLGPASGVSIESTARKGLLDQIVENKTIEMSLRESVSFRRSEVAALGARTLLLMGFCDDYFGADGILRNEAQKSHWTEHFLALQAMIDRGGDAADALSQSLQQMDAAEAKVLYDTLVSYSDQQLAAGADFDLVEGLNSTSMPLRVLSSEALRQITGTTYYFRPHDKNAARRSPTVKRWDTRQKKGDIRWEKKQLPLALLDE